MPGEATRHYLAAMRNRGPLDIRWDCAPTRHKRYPDAARVRLPWHEPAPATVEEMAGALLGELLGLSRLVWLHQLDEEGSATGGAPLLVLGRPAPSGGALYPIEGYLALGSGVYHYDPVHHVLELVRAGDHRSALGHSDADADGVLVLSAVFWRSMFKYGDFGYRLLCQETGVLLAQAAAAGARQSIGTRAHLCFRDADLEQVLGLDGRREAALAAVSLTFPARSAGRSHRTAASGDLARESAPLPLALPEGPAADLHQAGAAAHREPVPFEALPEPPSAPGPRVTLPAVPPAIGSALRTSPTAGYHPVPLPQADLAAILAAASSTHLDELPSATTTTYLIALQVEGLPPGGYRYHPHDRTLTAVGRPVSELMTGRLHANTRVALRGAAAVLVPVGDPLAGVEWFGDRWYRLQQAATGLLLQHATLAAVALGRAARIHSDGANDVTDRVLGLAGTPWSSLSFLVTGTPLTRGPSLVRGLSPHESREVITDQPTHHPCEHNPTP